MNQYKIIVTEYSESGAPTGAESTYYADTAEHAEQLYNQYNKMRQESGMKAYKVDLYINCYKYIADANDFFNQFKA